MTTVAASAPGIKPQATTLNLRQRTQTSLNPLNLHYGGLAIVVLINLYLLAHMAFLWHQASSQDVEAITQQQIALKAAEIAARPLEGLDVKLIKASADADAFYQDRLPLTYSQVASELGVLAKRQGIHLGHIQYAQAPVSGEGASGAKAGQLTEIRMDASLTGDYRPLVLFLNGLERDKVFFHVNSIMLTGQQTGTVNLRMRLTTYLRGLAPGEQKAIPPSAPASALDQDLDAQAAKAVQAAQTTPVGAPQ